MQDIGRSLSWGALGAFLRRLDLDSETARELEPDLSPWAGQLKTNVILADIYDVLATINSNIVAIASGKKAKSPKKYPRPGDKQEKRIGKNALPIEEIHGWFDDKRKKRKKER